MRQQFSKWWIIGLLVLILAMLLLQTLPRFASTVPAGFADLQHIPEKLDNQYKYNVNSVSDLVTYTDADGKTYQAYIYWASDRRLHIVRREFPTGSFQTPIDIHAAIGNDPLEFDSHNSSALGIASNGMMFITGNHHVDPLNIGKTQVPYDISSFSYLTSGLVEFQNSRSARTVSPDANPVFPVLPTDLNRVTYPDFFYLNGDLYFSYREQEVGKQAPRFRWLIHRYDPATDQWNRSAQLNTGISLRLYISNFAISPDGSSIHVFALWRDDKAGGGTANQHDYFHLYSNDGIDWYNYGAGHVVSRERTLWFDNGDKTLPGYTGVQLDADDLIWDTPPDPIPVNAGSAVVDTGGFPHALVRSRSGELYHHYWRGSSWVNDVLSNWTGNSVQTIACGSGVGALISDGESIVYRSLQKTDASYSTPVMLANGFTNVHYTLSVDQGAAARGYVSFLLTRSSHHKPGTVKTVNPQPAWIATFSCADLETAVSFENSQSANL